MHEAEDEVAKKVESGRDLGHVAVAGVGAERAEDADRKLDRKEERNAE